MKSRFPGTCSICTLGYNAGDEITPTEPRLLPIRWNRMTTVRWAHVKCAQARAFMPKSGELVDCPRCESQVEWKRLGGHLDSQHGMDGYQAQYAMRRILYDRAGVIDGQPT